MAEAKQIAATCPKDRLVAGRAAIDVGEDRVQVAGDAGRLAPVRSLAEFVAICGGHLRVDVFAGAAGATAAVYDSDINAVGSTENARLRRVPKMVDEVMATVGRQLPGAAATLPQDGKDVVAQFGLSSEYAHQLDPYIGSDHTRYVLSVVITTDGVQTTDPSLTDPTLTITQAKQLAQQIAPLDLSGADVHVTDVGKPISRSVPTSYTDALKAFYRRVCENAKAAHCVVVTDAAGR